MSCTEFDADEIRRLGKRFKKLDLDGSGSLSIEDSLCYNYTAVTGRKKLFRIGYDKKWNTYLKGRKDFFLISKDMKTFVHDYH